MASISLKLSEEYRKKTAVISHERSGTHFLMNTLALNYHYMSDPWWNFDFDQALNFHAPRSLLDYLKQVHDKPVLNILKSHHPFPFFREIIDYLGDQFFIFYIYRDPRDIMLSNWKLITHFHTLHWDEGPAAATIGDFIRSAPCSAMLRYQKRQEKSVLHRWRSHVEGWLDHAEGPGAGSTMALSYEELNLDFENTVIRMGDFLGEQVGTPIRPGRNINVIGPGKNGIGATRNSYTEADHRYLVAAVGDTMERLGYPLSTASKNQYVPSNAG